MKTLICLILVFTLALNSAYTKRLSKQPTDNFNVKKIHQQPKADTKTSFHSSSSEKESQILHKNIEMKGDGSFHYDFETSNGIKRTEKGAIDGTIQGSSSYLSPEGIEIKTTYVADETGYHPVGDHIPQVPDYIVRALEYIRNHPYIEKDYYTGEVKQTSLSNKIPLIATTKHTAYSKSINNKKKTSHNSNNNFKH